MRGNGNRKLRGATAHSLDVYLNSIHRYRQLSRDEEFVLARRIADGDENALQALVCANLRFVVSVSKKYQHHGVSLADLINEGNLGLIRAARRFDGAKGVKFISYAVWWVRQAVLQALVDQSRIVCVPPRRLGALRRIGRRASSLAQQFGRLPSAGEIADHLALSEEEIGAAMSISRTDLSLDAELAAGPSERLIDVLADDTTPAPDQPTFDKALTQSVAEALSSLREREARVIRLYFGFGGEQPMTLEQIASLMGITRERVRQIKQRALSRLRHIAAVRALRG